MMHQGEKVALLVRAAAPIARATAQAATRLTVVRFPLFFNASYHMFSLYPLTGICGVQRFVITPPPAKPWPRHERRRLGILPAP